MYIDIASDPSNRDNILIRSLQNLLKKRYPDFIKDLHLFISSKLHYDKNFIGLIDAGFYNVYLLPKSKLDCNITGPFMTQLPIKTRNFIENNALIHLSIY